ncbi:MAG: hypothetical protein H7A24_01615 [Leptospiraceae bacterium]|nr:hypothetical protein [Leptospiraceae bacterium]MCP5510552.1 hypothetical protein [Leptospiraceae bacterium]
MKKSIPRTIFKKGDLATIIEIEDSSEDKIYVTLEFFTSVGESIAKHSVPLEYIEPLSPLSIPNMRKIKKK